MTTPAEIAAKLSEADGPSLRIAPAERGYSIYLSGSVLTRTQAEDVIAMLSALMFVLPADPPPEDAGLAVRAHLTSEETKG